MCDLKLGGKCSNTYYAVAISYLAEVLQATKPGVLSGQHSESEWISGEEIPNGSQETSSMSSYWHE